MYHIYIAFQTAKIMPSHSIWNRKTEKALIETATATVSHSAYPKWIRESIVFIPPLLFTHLFQICMTFLFKWNKDMLKNVLVALVHIKKVNTLIKIKVPIRFFLQQCHKRIILGSLKNLSVNSYYEHFNNLKHWQPFCTIKNLLRNEKFPQILKVLWRNHAFTLQPETGCPLKLSRVEPGQYLDGRPPGETRLLLEEVVRPAHPVVCVGPNAPV